MPADRTAWAYFDTSVLVKCPPPFITGDAQQRQAADAIGLNVVLVK